MSERLAFMRSLPEKLRPRNASKTLSERRAETGRTLALNGAAWRRLRASVLSEQPVCPHCADLGYTTLAVEVDHVDDDPTNNSRDNLMGLCRMHHGLKTRGHAAQRASAGCDVHGMPLSASHPWNLEKSPATGEHEPSGSPRLTANRGTP